MDKECNNNRERANCYNCGKTVYGKSEANAGGHVFCCRNCRSAWERDEARKARAKRRAEEARRINRENARIDAENARRWAEQRQLDKEAEARNDKYYGWAWAVAILLVLWAISHTAAVIAAVLGIGWLARKWICSAAN